MAIIGIGLARPAKGCDRRLALAEPLTDFAECELGRCELRRKFDCLLKQVGGGNKIALQLQVAREFEATVGDQIAGGQEQARGHFQKTRR